MKIEKGTIIRTVILALALINQVLTVYGKSPIPVDDATVELLIATSWTVVSALVAWWKNNSFTQEALQAQEVLQYIRAEKVEPQNYEEDEIL